MKKITNRMVEHWIGSDHTNGVEEITPENENAVLNLWNT